MRVIVNDIFIHSIESLVLINDFMAFWYFDAFVFRRLIDSMDRIMNDSLFLFLFFDLLLQISEMIVTQMR